MPCIPHAVDRKVQPIIPQVSPQAGTEGRAKSITQTAFGNVPVLCDILNTDSRCSCLAQIDLDIVQELTGSADPQPGEKPGIRVLALAVAPAGKQVQKPGSD